MSTIQNLSPTFCGAARMNLFKEILPRVREILDSASAPQAHALLNLLLEEGIISKEYHQTLMHEKDREDLARKVSLMLVEKWDVCLNPFPLLCCLSLCGKNSEDAPSGADVPATKGGVQENAMDPGNLSEKSYLDLLNSDVDPLLLYKHIEEHTEIATDQATNALFCDQDTNPDVFYTVESDDSGEELSLCASTGEAYDKIAALADYVLKDQQDKPIEDLFGNLISDETASECPGGCAETKKHSSCSTPPEPKRRKVAHSPTRCAAKSGSVVSPLNVSPAGSVSQSNFHVTFSVTTIGAVGRIPVIFGPSLTPTSGDFPLTTKGIQMTFTCVPRPLSIALPVGPGASVVNVCPGDVVLNKGPEILAVPSELGPQRPDAVDAFCTSQKNSFMDMCKFISPECELPLDRLYIEGALVQGHIESRSGRNAGKAEEKELGGCDLNGKRKGAVERSQLFQMPSKKPPGTKVIVVLGKAGMGKSVFIQKMCLDWANGAFPDFDFVFQFHCWHLTLRLEERCSLRQLLWGLSNRPPEGEDEIFTYIVQNPEKVLLIFDGFEELVEQDSFPPCSDSLPPKEAVWGIREIFAGLFQKTILNGCSLLLTSRPKDKLHYYLPQVDKTVKVVGFSRQQAELYIARYFEGSPCCHDAVDIIKRCPYLASHCCRPDMCHLVCESVHEIGTRDLPSTVTGLLLQKLLHAMNTEEPLNHGNLMATLAQVAWSLGQTGRDRLTDAHFPSSEVKALALRYEIVVPFVPLENISHRAEEREYKFSSLMVQNFLAALHLVLTKEIKDKKLTKYLWLPTKTKKSFSSWDLVPRLLSGILFLRDDHGLTFLLVEEGESDMERMMGKKRKSLSKYIRKLEIKDLNPDKLLEVLHCVQETEDHYLLQHLALRLRPDLSFLGFSLSPPDVYVLCSVLRRSKKKFVLDLRKSSINLEGLQQLVGLENVTSFRASLGDVIQLWKHLLASQEGEDLHSATKKFIMDPFKAETMKDIEDLCALVDLQERMSQSKEDSAICRSHAIAAVEGLRRFEFALGPVDGLKGFKKLLGILQAFPNLQHLDLDSENENELGDEGVMGLADILPRLVALETLNLSQNKITDVGAESLASALPHLPLLKTLSLYNNNIGDVGAEKISDCLPKMAALRVLNVQWNKITGVGAQELTGSLSKCPRVQSLALWNPTIPHGVLEHLRQLDSRIRLL